MNFIRCIVVAAFAFFVGSAAAQELRIGLASEPTAMDPHYHNLSPNNSLLTHIFERLVGQDERQRLTPDLAESWKAIDATTWEFKLRRNVRFHDGTPFTADDVHLQLRARAERRGQPVELRHLRRAARRSPRSTTTRSTSRPRRPTR